MVFDLLYGRDEFMNPQPQMVEAGMALVRTKHTSD